jgi:hypothetical protein
LPDAPRYDAAFIDRVIDLGREGLTRAEVAAALGVSVERLVVWASEHSDFAYALERAASESLAWWDALPRAAVMKDNVFHPAVWSKAMVQRFGSPAHRTLREQDQAEKPKPDELEELATFDIPDNGRERPPRRKG